MPQLTQDSIIYNNQPQQPVYQRSKDSFFCLSQACWEIGERPSKYLNMLTVLALFASHSKYKPRFSKTAPGVGSLVIDYPDLVYHSRSPNQIDSGIWLHSLFIPSFVGWCEQIKGRKWGKFIPEANSRSHTYQVPTSRYEFIKASLTDNVQNIWLREADGFVRADSLENVRACQFHKLFEERSFITTLETVRDQLGLELDYEILNEQTLSYSERIYRLYKPMYDLQKIEENSVFWMHPELAKLFARSENLSKTIADWQQRTNSNNRCYIAQIDSDTEDDRIRHNLKKVEAEEMSAFRVSGCKVDLYDGEDAIYFKISQPQYSSQFIVCPNQHRVYISQNLLASWGLRTESGSYVDSDFRFKYFHTAGELQRGLSASNTLERLLNKKDTMCLNFDDCQVIIQSHTTSIEFCSDGESYSAFIPDKIALALKYYMNVVSSTFEQTNDLSATRLQLAEMGYNSPLLEDVVIKHEEFKTLKFGEVLVRQRLSDNFVSANDFYQPFGKDLSKWLKNDSTFEFFKAIAEKEQLNCNYPKRGSSDYQRVTKCFPALIERVNGSPKYGGVTWIHPLIALNLAQTISGEFAAEAVYILRDYYVNKALEKNHGEMRSPIALNYSKTN